MTDPTGTGTQPVTSNEEGGRGSGAFAALGRFIVANPWKVIAAWIVVAVAVIATSPALPTTTNESSFLPSSYESIRASALQSRAFPQQGHVTAAAAIIVFSRPDGGPLTAADSASVVRVAQALNARHIPRAPRLVAGPRGPVRRACRAGAAPLCMDMLPAGRKGLQATAYQLHGGN